MVEKKVYEMPKNPKVDEARQHMRAARQNMHKVVESMVPEGVLENRKAARKEFLLGLRSLLDAAIDHSENHTS